MTVSNHITKRYQKFNASQPSLWEDEQPVYHQLIEVHYQSGHRETYCCENAYRPTGGIEIYAGYVGFPVPADDCTFCNRKAAH